MPIQDGHGGGNPSSKITAFPSSVNLGNVPASTTVSGIITVHCSGTYGDTAQVTSISVTGAGYTLSGLPSLPDIVVTQSGFNFNVLFNLAGLGIHTGTIVIDWVGDQYDGEIKIPLTATVVSTNILVVPPSINFGDTIINVVNAGSFGSNQVVVTNNTGATIHITALAFSNPDFTTAPGSPGLPITLANGGSTTLLFQVTPSIIGPEICTVTVTTDIAGPYTFPIQLSVIGILFLENFPLANSLRAFLLGDLGLHQLNPTNFNSELASTLVFNGTLWDKPGQEKTLKRLQIFYENLGVFIITAIVSTIRYKPDGTKFTDSVNASITLGDVSADGLEYSTYEDLQMSGELLTLSISREINAGAVSLIGFVPHFDDKGEKAARV